MNSKRVHDKTAFPYVVIGSGIIPSDNLVEQLKIRFRIRVPIPVYMFARTMNKAMELAKKMETLHESVYIAEIKKVVKG